MDAERSVLLTEAHAHLEAMDLAMLRQSVALLQTLVTISITNDLKEELERLKKLGDGEMTIKVRHGQVVHVVANVTRVRKFGPEEDG